MNKFLFCIDSDGCAIDSMEVKHRYCFGPGIIKIWHLEQWENEILNRWNEINLYSMTRGINRFPGLNMMLTEVDRNYQKIDGIHFYQQWCASTAAFSNELLEKQVQANIHPIFQEALNWSYYVNDMNLKIADKIHPFAGVKETLETLQQHNCDIAIVSSANPRAVKDEWSRFELLDKVNYVMTQDSGTKTECIRKLLEKGYAPSYVVMVGDAPGDLAASTANQVAYYPILAGKEESSWLRLKKEAIPKFLSGQYHADYQEELINLFTQNLTGIIS